MVCKTVMEEPPHSDKPSDAPNKKRLIRWIMLAVAIWGGFLASGLWLSTHKWQGPAVVMSCVFGFLGFWACMLARRARESKDSF
jgi:hypothetical protein